GGAEAHRVRSLRHPGRELAAVADRVHCHLHSACIGSGIEIPAFAGRVSAAPTTFFQLPELGMGLIPGAGGCVSIARRIGRQRTAWLVLSGSRINARTALDWGLIDAIEN
ncbi:MAG: enoyl-CoA hydratase/isomerase family protein, partial [Halioglobus sp.]|nr:enoyl-CoA hydratase/isomerase family protein [Halioglobus sp.]